MNPQKEKIELGDDPLAIFGGFNTTRSSNTLFNAKAPTKEPKADELASVDFTNLNLKTAKPQKTKATTPKVGTAGITAHSQEDTTKRLFGGVSKDVFGSMSTSSSSSSSSSTANILNDGNDFIESMRQQSNAMKSTESNIFNDNDDIFSNVSNTDNSDRIHSHSDSGTTTNTGKDESGQVSSDPSSVFLTVESAMKYKNNSNRDIKVGVKLGAVRDTRRDITEDDDNEPDDKVDDLMVGKLVQREVLSSEDYETFGKSQTTHLSKEREKVIEEVRSGVDQMGIEQDGLLSDIDKALKEVKTAMPSSLPASSNTGKTMGAADRLKAAADKVKVDEKQDVDPFDMDAYIAAAEADAAGSGGLFD